MQKRRVAPLYAGIFVIALISMSICTLFFIYLEWCTYRDGQIVELGMANWILLSSIFLGFAAIICCIVEIAGSFLQAQYTIDSTGMKTFTLKKEYFLKWEDVKEVGIVSIPVNQISNTYIVYCTTVPLSQKEKSHFLWHRKKRFTDTMYFQFKEAAQISELLRYVPEQWKYKIQVQASTYGIMKWSDFCQEIEPPKKGG